VPTVLTPFRAYQIYNSLKLHFTQEKYDVGKYGTATKRFSIANFEKQNNYMYHSVAKALQTEDVFTSVVAANLVRDPSIWINGLDKELATTLRKYNKSSQYFMNDFSDLMQKYTFKELVCEFPSLIISGEVEPELIAMLSRLVPIYKLLDRDCPNRFMWDLVKLRLQKYTRFVIINTAEEQENLSRFVTETLKNRKTDIQENQYVLSRT